MNDFRFAFRQFLKNPGFTSVAVLTLALGIGANTAIFSVVNTVLLRPMPLIKQPERILMLWSDNPKLQLGIQELPPANADVTEWRKNISSFEHIAALRSQAADVSDDGDPERIGGVATSASLFPALGVQPQLGTVFSQSQEVSGNDRVAIISHGLWQRRFGGTPDIVGRTITVNRERRTIIGVMPSRFDFPRAAEMPTIYDLPARTELWVPLAEDTPYWANKDLHQLIVLARLKPDVTPAQAQAEIDAFSARREQADPSKHKDWRAWTTPLTRQVVGRTRAVLLVLLGSVALVLLIACANVASLMLSRSNARRHEMAIRAAIGAGRGRIIRQLMTESILLSLVGGFFGLLLGSAGVKLLLAVSPSNLPRLDETSIDGRVFGFTLLTSVVTGILFGLVPTWHASKVNLAEALNASGRTNAAGGYGRTFGVLVIGEVAVAVTLLVGAALMLQSFWHLAAVDIGFQARAVAAFDVTLHGPRYKTDALKIEFFRRALEKLEALPGVHRVAAISSLPLSGSGTLGSLDEVEGFGGPQGNALPMSEARLVTPGYFDTMGIGLMKGRDFIDDDGLGKPAVVVVNETLVRQFYPDIDPLGKRLKMNGGDWATIVGVVRDVRGFAPEAKPHPQVYWSYPKRPSDEMTVVLRADPKMLATLEATLRREFKTLDAAMPVANFRTMEHLVASAVARPRFGSFLFGLFALTALLLTVVGLYGVVAYTVSQRTRELGIRLALGAQQLDVLALILWQGMQPVLMGLGLGVVGAFALTRLLVNQLYEINPTDPKTFIAICSLLLTVALLACWLPARRASRVDPLVALRSE